MEIHGMVGAGRLNGNGSQARILIVDDENNIRKALSRALSLGGYHTREADSGSHALEMLAREPWDLMILDIQMPELSGTEVMRRAHELYPELLIIILTGHATLETAIEAVKSEAVDYLLKPASLHDIGVTVNNVLRNRAERQNHRRLLEIMGEAMDALRKGQPAAPLPAREASCDRFLKAGPLTLDCSKRLVAIADNPGRAAELTEGEAMILAVLIDFQNQVLSCRQLARDVWGYEMDEREAQSLIRPHIFRMRHKIESDPEQPRLIQTVRGRGYMFCSI